MAEFAAYWVKEYCRPPFRSAYLGKNREAAIRLYLLPTVGHLRLSEIEANPQHLSVAQRALFARGLAHSTVRLALGIFGEIWKAARIEGLVRGRPSGEVMWPRLKKKRPTVFTGDEQELILDEFAKRRAWSLPLVATVFLAGTRPSEAAGLRWADLDQGTHQLEVVKPIVSGESTDGKTAKSLRRIKISPRLMELLLCRRKQSHGDDDLVVANTQGNPAHTGRFSVVYFKPVLDQLELKYRPLYAGRHTFITLALMHGAGAAQVAEYCGTSIHQITESYLSWIGAVEDPMRGKRGPAPYLRREHEDLPRWSHLVVP